MIAKHVPMRSLGKSDFAGLVNYITDEQSKEHRLGSVQLTNCEAYSVQDAVSEVLATQFANTRARSDKTYHLIVSFRAGEQIEADTLAAIEDRICEGLGFGEHQRRSQRHRQLAHPYRRQQDPPDAQHHPRTLLPTPDAGRAVRGHGTGLWVAAGQSHAAPTRGRGACRRHGASRWY